MAMGITIARKMGVIEKYKKHHRVEVRGLRMEDVVQRGLHDKRRA